MTTVQINILNPKATKWLSDMAEMKLISIQKKTKGAHDFEKYFKKIQSKLKKKSVSIDEINKEVEIVRSKRYAASKK